MRERFNKFINFLFLTAPLNVKVSILIFTASLIFVKTVSSQDIHNTQFFNNQIALNPAMSGLVFGPRVILDYRNNYPSIGDGAESGYTTYSISYDQHISKMNSGLGILLQMDNISGGVYQTYNVYGNYAYQIRLNRKLGLKLGTNFGFTSEILDWNKLKFYDQIDPIDGFLGNIPTTEAPPISLSNTQFDAGFGFLFFNRKFYAGATAKHLTLKKKFFFDSNKNTISPLYLGAHVGMNFVINKRTKFFVSPNINYAYQYTKHEIVPVVVVNYELVNIGLGMRNTLGAFESMIFYLGISKGIVKVNYSYDHTLGSLAGKTGGSHELCFRFVFKGDDSSLKPNSESGFMECPDILKK